MKRLLCTILALAMLCSFMVVNVSATNVYSAEGYEIKTSYDCSIEGSISERGYDENIIYCDDLSGYIIIGSQKWFDEPENLYYENYDYYTSGEIVVNGNTAAYVENISEGYYECEMQLYSDYYYYTIHVRAYDEESYNAWLEILDSFTFTYDDELYYEYYENYFPTTSTYWETDTFYIDTDMELVMKDDSEYYEDEDAESYRSYSFYPVEYDEGWGYQDIGCSIDIFVYHPDDVDEGYNELVDMLNEWYEYNEYGDDDWDVYEINDTKLNGFDAVQFDAILRGDVEFAMFSRSIAVSDGENAYLIEIDCDPEYEDVFNDLCDIVENDLHFNNSPAVDKSEDKADEDDKSDKKDAEEKDNSTIIIVAIVAGAVVIIGVTAIIVLGKKKKQ